MAEMTHGKMIGGLLHDIARAQCHLEDADRDLSVVAADLAKLMEALEPSTAHLLGAFARGLQNHLNELGQFDEAIHVTLTSLADRLESLTSGRAAPERRGDGYTPKNHGGSTDIRRLTLCGNEFSLVPAVRGQGTRTFDGVDGAGGLRPTRSA